MSRNGKTTNRPMQEDDELIKSFLSDNADAFARLVIKHQSMVFNLCFRIVGDYDDANDCAQETFIKVYNSLKNFRFESSFTTWLYRIAVNTCRNRISSSDSRISKKMVRINNPGVAGGDTIEIHDCSFEPDALYEKNERTRLVHKAIDALPGDLKILIVLRDLEGNSYEDISEMTGVNLGTVKSRLARARHLLRETLREAL